MEAGRLATALGLELRGAPARRVTGLAPLGRAGPEDLAFVVDARRRDDLARCRAGLVICPASLADAVPGDALVSPDPYASYARASWLLAPEAPASPPGVHPAAVVAPDARLGAGVSVGAGATIGPGAVLCDGVRVGESCAIGAGVRIGAGTRLFPRVTLGEGTTLGRDCRVQSGAVIGSEGFGYAPSADGWLPIHQLGGVRIGDRVHVGANTTIDRGALDPTVIGDGVILDNLIQIAHNVRIGENTAIAACTGVAGSATVGANCLVGGACNINGHIEIAPGTTVTATSFVQRSITEPGTYGAALPLQESARWRRTFASIGRLEELVRRVRALERALKRARRGPADAGPAVGDPTAADRT